MEVMRKGVERLTKPSSPQKRSTFKPSRRGSTSSASSASTDSASSSRGARPVQQQQQPPTKHTDQDIQAAIDSFARKVSQKYHGQKIPVELVRFTGSWLTDRLRQERCGWSEKLQDALREIEVQRRHALAADALVNVCNERLQILVDCFRLQDSSHGNGQVKFEATVEEDPGKAILLYSDSLMELIHRLMEDHLQSLEMLQVSPDNNNNNQDRILSIAKLLRGRFTSEEKIKSDLISKSQQSLKEKQDQVVKSRQNQSLEGTVRKLETEVGQLRLKLKKEQSALKTMEDDMAGKHWLKNKVTELEGDVQQLRKLAVKKQDYIDWLKKQFFDLTKTLAEDQQRNVHASQTKGVATKNTKSTCTNGVMLRGSNPRSQLPATINLVKESSILHSTIPISAGSTETDTSSTETSTEISDDKLNILKVKVRKLEESLKEALNQMSQYSQKDNNSDDSKAVAKATGLSSNATENEGVITSHEADNKIRDLRTRGVVLKVPDKHSILRNFVCDRKQQSMEHQGIGRNPKLNQSLTELRQALTLPNKQGVGNKMPRINAEKFQSDTEAIPRRRQVTKCLRCNKIFRSSNNHKLACSFHMKGKDRIEKYDENGKLRNVYFVWQCCGKSMDDTACCSGHHV